MRHFSSQARTINLVRKVGYYPNRQVANRVAQAFGYLFEDPSNTQLFADYLMGDRDAWEKCISCLTAAEYKLILGFSDWYSCELVDPLEESSGGDCTMDFENVLGSYVALNLNSGLCYVFTAVRILKWKDDRGVLRPTEPYGSEEV